MNKICRQNKLLLIQRKSTLGISFDKFFNGYSAKVAGFPKLYLNDIQWSSNNGRREFYQDFADSVALFGEVDRSQNLINLTVTCDPTNFNSTEEKIIARAIAVYLALMGVISPNLNSSDYQYVIDKLSANLKKSSFVYGDVVYSSRVYGTKLILTLESARYD